VIALILLISYIRRRAVFDNQSIGPTPHVDSPDQEPPEIRIIGDFDGGASALWTLYRNEAKSYDESRILTLKDDMDGVLIFVRSILSTYTMDFDSANAHSRRPVCFLLLSRRL
jgi:hypothetical protein